MATVGTNCLTLTDWAKRLDPDGSVSVVVEMLSQTNDILTSELFMEGNLPTGHRVTMRTGLPTVAWRLLNQGVTPSKSRTAQVDEATGIMEAWSEVDKDLAELNGNVAAFRLSEAQPFIEAMNVEHASTLIYGNSSTAPEEFTGLAVRYSSSTATNGQNVIKGGGSGGDNSSVWLIVWGPQTCFGIFPKGSKAGIDHEDRGVETVETTAGIAGSRMLAYRERWQWKTGICLKDWRYVVRICNIDISALVAESANADLQKKMIMAIHRIPTMGLGRPSFYMNRTCLEMLDIQSRNDVKSGGGITFENVAGKPIYSFRGIPIGCVDALTEAEATVS